MVNLSLNSSGNLLQREKLEAEMAVEIGEINLELDPIDTELEELEADAPKPPKAPEPDPKEDAKPSDGKDFEAFMVDITNLDRQIALAEFNLLRFVRRCEATEKGGIPTAVGSGGTSVSIESYDRIIRSYLETIGRLRERKARIDHMGNPDAPPPAIRFVFDTRQSSRSPIFVANIYSRVTRNDVGICVPTCRVLPKCDCCDQPTASRAA